MKGVKVSLDTTVNENLYKGVSEFIATATGQPRLQGDVAYIEINVPNDFLKEGDYFTTSCYVDADNLKIVDNPLNTGYGPGYAGYGECQSDFGWSKSPVKFGKFPYGNYKHKKIVLTIKVTKDMVGATSLHTWFRRDDWGAGTVRIYDIKVEKSPYPTDYEE